MYLLVLVVLTSFGEVNAKPIGKVDTLELCEEVRVLMLAERPAEVMADAVCVKMISI